MIESIENLDVGTVVTHVSRGMGRVLEFKEKVGEAGAHGADGDADDALNVLQERMGRCVTRSGGRVEGGGGRCGGGGVS